MAMTDTDSHNTSEKIKISAPLCVPEVLHVALVNIDGRLVERQQTGNQVVLSDAQHFFLAFTLQETLFRHELCKYSALHIYHRLIQ